MSSKHFNLKDLIAYFLLICSIVSLIHGYHKELETLDLIFRSMILCSGSIVLFSINLIKEIEEGFENDTSA